MVRSIRVLSCYMVTCLLIIIAGCGQSAPPEEEPVPVNPMNDFGMTASNVFFYYTDLEGATKFYTETLGLNVAADYGFAKILQVAPTSFITLVDETKGMHKSSEPKTVAIALVTDQLDAWWDYIEKQNVEIKFPYKGPQEGRAHDGFVAIDPEGYFLEFERFNAHEENEKLMPLLDKTATLYPPADQTTTVPEGLGFKATVVWFYYKDMAGIQKFYEEVLGFDLIVDQGWAKIYPISPSGYFGLVDEQRGMHNFTEEKAVTMSFWTDRLDDWYAYTSTNEAIKMRSEKIEEENPRYRAFVSYDPEGYYLEWDVFNGVPDNEELLKIIKGQ